MRAAALRAWLGLRSRPRQILGAALLASLLAHVLVASLPEQPAPAAPPVPLLAATITQMPPPPLPAVKHVTTQRKARAAPAPATVTALAYLPETAAADVMAALAVPVPAAE